MEEKRRRKATKSRGGSILSRLFCMGVLAGTLAMAWYRWRAGDLLRQWWETGSLSRVNVLSRTYWNAASARGKTEKMASPSRITIHHTGGKVVGDFDRDAAARAIKAIQKHHQEDRQWNDIAYHYVVDRGGRVWQGRPLSQVGAHAGSRAANQANIGILLLGNFDLQVPSGAQLESLRRLVDTLCITRGIHRNNILGHDDVRSGSGLGHTRCPGRHLEAWIERYRGG